jgi:predicted SAM-dependent methyltransferase
VDGVAALRCTRRLNWGCGPRPVAGWLNADRRVAPGVDLLSDIRDGLPLATGSIQYIAAIHALQDLPYLAVVPALCELRRVLKAGGVLRLALPDFDRAIAALLNGDAGYFYIDDEEARTLSGKFIVQMTWYGSNRMMFNHEFAAELLLRAGFTRVERAAFGETTSAFPEIVTLDNRPRESIFVEAYAPPAEPAP